MGVGGRNHIYIYIYICMHIYIYAIYSIQLKLLEPPAASLATVEIPWLLAKYRNLFQGLLRVGIR